MLLVYRPRPIKYLYRISFTEKIIVLVPPYTRSPSDASSKKHQWKDLSIVMLGILWIPQNITALGMLWIMLREEMDFPEPLGILWIFLIQMNPSR